MLLCNLQQQYKIIYIHNSKQKPKKGISTISENGTSESNKLSNEQFRHKITSNYIRAIYHNVL